MLIKFGHLKQLKNSINPKNSTTIVNALAKKNFPISNTISLKLEAVELNTSFLFVIYANITARIIATLFAIFSFQFAKFVKQ